MVTAAPERHRTTRSGHCRGALAAVALLCIGNAHAASVAAAVAGIEAAPALAIALAGQGSVARSANDGGVATPATVHATGEKAVNAGRAGLRTGGVPYDADAEDGAGKRPLPAGAELLTFQPAVRSTAVRLAPGPFPRSSDYNR